MNQYDHIVPPKWPRKFLRFFVKKEYLEEIEGDMEEIFRESLEEHSVRKAKRIYAFEALKLFRPILIKNLGGDYRLNHYGMFKNYLKTSLRSLKKNTLFSSINIVGLAIGMSVGILMILLLSELHSFDDFHAQKDNIYRVTSTRTLYGREGNYSTASYYIGSQIDAQIPGVDKVLIMGRDMSADLRTEEKAIPITGFYAPTSFFDFFSFKLKKGNPQTALADPNNIVLTESASKKLFGDADPMGELVSADGHQDFQNGIITGVIEDPPVNSHMQFEALVALKTLDKRAEGQERNFKDNPRDMYNSYVYLVLNESTKTEEVEDAIGKIMNDYNSNAEAPITHRLQPLDTFVTSDTYVNGTGPRFSQRKIYVMIGLTLIVLLSACFNYTNLSLARALRRSKEVGVRKVTGATRFQVFIQFMLEAVILSLIALIAGLGLFFLIRPEFLNLPNPAARGYQMFLLDINYLQLLYFLLFAIGVGCLAGFLPAMFLSKLKARIVFNNASKVKLFSGVNLRRVLIVFQFAMSIGLIMCAVLVHRQYKFALNYDLGFTTEKIVNIRLKGDYANLLENEYSKIPEVVETSKSSVVLGVGSAMLTMIKSEDKSSTVSLLMSEVDERYFNMHEFEILAGSGFLSPLREDESPKYVVVNEAFLKGLNLGSPKEAIGKYVWRGDTRLEILGVVGDFVSITLNINLEDAFGFLQTSKASRYHTLGVKIRSNDLLATMGKLEESYKGLDPVHPFEATFYDDQIALAYQPQKTTYTIISFLAFLAISISTLGLLGMAVYTTESRMKEVSIRKVLGAGISNLMLLLSRSFLVMIAVAGTVAVPITLYLVDNMILNEFLYRAKIGLIEILSGFVIVMVISALTIGWQIRMAAVRNPVDTLRND
ncbi:ABC transporter permease [Fulvivirgaceae bacterium BMA10]|uniref:ABC transporter permease n=1 Tax=Splendidivirga corallicola TaxID=3051826 RepID=A0ABT8KJW0_9BACT|nr:ABC transporter permease [Fulvivirgaceae bacterium BMA10]